MSGPRGVLMPSHAFFADDLMVFCKGNKRSFLNLMALFRLYGDIFGQHLSPNKCCFYHGPITRARSQLLSSWLGFNAGSIPFTYLGVPIFLGKPRKSHLQPIAVKIINKLATWKGLLLSYMGRVQLVQSVIQGMTLHSFMVYPWPISLLKNLDAAIRNFVWMGN